MNSARKKGRFFVSAEPHRRDSGRDELFPTGSRIQSENEKIDVIYISLTRLRFLAIAQGCRRPMAAEKFRHAIHKNRTIVLN